VPPAKTKKATFVLDAELLTSLSKAVEQGAASSADALVDRALRRELTHVDRRTRAARWKEAGLDPLFRNDVRDVEEAFTEADAETARSLE